jgi:hypothetical protein
MLYLDTSFELQGLTLFRDFNSRSRFYYMPAAPHLTVDGGQPMFQLLIYRRDITDNPDFHAGDRPGGGFLTMTVDLSVPRSTLDAVKGKLAAYAEGGEVELAPVPFEDGSVRISALGASAGRAGALEADAGADEQNQSPRFVERILGGARPSLYGDNRATFSFELSQEGAVLMRASIQQPGATQVAVIYDLTYRGLLPAYQATIEIDAKQCYDYLHTRFTANTLWFRADLDSEFEKLQREQHIRIVDVDYQESDPGKRAERAQKLQDLAKELATWTFFRPGLTPGRVVADDRGSGLVAANPTPTGPIDPSGASSLKAAGNGTGAAGDTSGPRVQGDSANPAPTRVNGQPPPAPSSAPAEGGNAAGGGGENAFDAWNRAGRPQAAYMSRELHQEELQTITFNLNQASAATRPASPQSSIRMLGYAAQLPGRIQEVDLDDPFFAKIAGSVTTSVDLAAAGVSTMVVKLRYGTRDDGSFPKDSKEFVLAKAGDQGTYEFLLDRGKTVDLEYQVVVTWKSGFALGSADVQTTSDWIRTTTRNLDVDPAQFGAHFPVTLALGAVDWSGVQSAVSTLEHAGDARTTMFAQGTPTQVTVPVRPDDPAKRAWRVSTVWRYANGIEETTTAEGAGQGIAVLNPPSTLVVPVTIDLRDPLAHYQKIVVDLAFEGNAATGPQTRSVTLAGDGATATWSYFLAAPTREASERAYKYRVTLFGTDGSTNELPWQSTNEYRLLVGDRFEGLLDVEVDVIADFAALGLAGMKLRLEYPDAAPGVNPVSDQFFRSPPASFHWRVPRKAGGGDQYRYTVDWIRANGTKTTVGPVTANDQTLLLFAPEGI